MADTKRNLSDLLNNMPVGVEDGTSVQDVRDALVSIWGARRVDMVTADTTVTTDHSVIIVDASGGNVTVTLPSVHAGSEFEHRVFTFKRIDTSANTVSVTCDPADRIDGARPYNLTAVNDFITVVGLQGNWYIIAKG